MKPPGKSTLARILFAGGFFLIASVFVFLFVSGSFSRPSTKTGQLVQDLRSHRPVYFSIIVRKPVSSLVPAAWLRKEHMAWSEAESKRSRAVAELSEMGTNAWPEIPRLVNCLMNGDLYAAYAAACVLSRIQADRSPDWPMQATQLRGARKAASAFEYLIRPSPYIPPGSVAALRKFGITGLGFTGPATPKAQETLIGVLKSPDESLELRTAATLSLGAMRANESTSSLLKQTLLDSQEWPDVSGSAAIALSRIAPDQLTRSLLEQSLKDDRSLVRLGAVQGLCNLQAPMETLIPTLKGLLEHKLVTVRLRTLKLIEDLGPDARPLQAQIDRLRTDPNPKISQAAIAASHRLSRN